MHPRILLPALAAAGRELLDLVAPTACAVCGAWGGRARGLCAACRRAMGVRPAWALLRAWPRPALPAVSAGEYAGVLARALRAMKDDERHDVRLALAQPLAVACRALLERLPPPPCEPTETIPAGMPFAELLAAHGVCLVAAPSSRAGLRRRGFDVPRLLVRSLGVRPSGRLVARAHLDQRGLDRGQRRENVASAVRVARVPRGGRVLIVDDVVTTGATALACAAALEGRGLEVVGVVCVARVAVRTQTTRALRWRELSPAPSPNAPRLGERDSATVR